MLLACAQLRPDKHLGVGIWSIPLQASLACSCAEMQAVGPALLNSVVFGSPGGAGCFGLAGEGVGTGHSHPKQQQPSSRQTPILPRPATRFSEGLMNDSVLVSLPVPR